MISISQQLRLAMLDYDAALENLIATYHETPKLYQSVSIIPWPTKKEVIEYPTMPLGRPSVIPVEPVTESLSIEATVARSFRIILGDEAHSTKHVPRFPGIILISDEAPDLRSAITTFNQEKEKFKELALTINNPDKRFETLTETFPMLMPKLLYRTIGIIDGPVTKINCSWRTGNQNTIKLTLDQVKDKLKSLLKNMSFLEHPESFEQSINRQLDDVSRLGHKIQFRSRRTQAPSVKATIEYKDKQAAKDLELPTWAGMALPFFVFNQGGQMPKITPLKTYDESKRPKRATRCDKIEDESILTQLGIFYEPKHE